MVMVSETLVDWLKHAFITKFNHIRPSVYERYQDVLCRDLANGSVVGRHAARKVASLPFFHHKKHNLSDLIRAQHTYVDQSPLVARRLGFASLPLAILASLIGSQSLGLIMDSGREWTWTRDAEIWVHRGKWAVMGLIFWVWYVIRA
jgi:hypothetical protein